MVHSSIAIGQNTSSAREEMSLTKATGGRFEIGVGVSDLIADNRKVGLLKKHFTILTPENCMKPQSFQRAKSKSTLRVGTIHRVRSEEQSSRCRTHIGVGKG